MPLIYGDKAGFDTTVYIQNAGDRTATVDLHVAAQDDCNPEQLCRSVSIAPGETLSWRPTGAGQNDPTRCVRPDWQGSARLESDQPLAAIVEIRGRDVQFDYAALAPRVAFDANGTPLPAGGRTMAYGPLRPSHEGGWDVGVQVQNLSRTRPAQVRVEFLDERGAQVSVLDDLICAAGSQTFFLPVDDARAERRVGSVRVISQRTATDLSAEPAPIVALATGLRYPDAARSQTLDAFAYELLPERASLARTPGIAGGTNSGIGAVSVTGLTRAGGRPTPLASWPSTIW